MILRIGMLLSIVSTAAIPFVTGTLLIITCIVGGIGISVVWTNSDALGGKLAKENEMGATMGMAGTF